MPTFRKLTLALAAMLGAAVALPGPALAQFSDSYKFLEAVRKRNDEDLQKLFEKGGPNLVNTRFERFDSEFASLRNAIVDNTLRLKALERALILMQADMRDLRSGVTRQLVEQDKRLAGIEQQLSGQDKRLGAMDGKLAHIDGKLDEILQRLPKI